MFYNMETLLAHQVGRVIIINVHRPIGWEYYINIKMAAEVVRWRPDAQPMDWNALSKHEQS